MEAKEYINLICNNINADTLLDAWWGYLADNKIWISKSTGKQTELKKMDGTHLYNIAHGITSMYVDQNTISPGAARLIGVIEIIMAKKAKEEPNDLPF